MKELLIYQLEVACCLTLFYVFYKAILWKETNFQLKRLFIIITSLLAFVLPAINIQYILNTGQMEIPIEFFTMIPTQLSAYSTTSVSNDEINIWAVFSAIWVIGFSIMVARLLLSLYHVNSILKDATKDPEGKSFKITNTNVQSFSFFKTIVLNTSHYHSEAKKYILAHEQAHSNQYHSFDVLFVELLKLVQWFNPIAWLIAKESIQNLEYLADKKVITSMKNMHDYQMAIVQFSHHSENKLLRTEFSKSNLKKRIVMMNQPNNQKIHLGKIMLILPMVAILFMSFSIKIENIDLRKELTEIFPILNIPTSIIDESWSISSISQLPLEPRKNDARISQLDTVETSDNKVFTIVDEKPFPSTGDIGSYLGKINADLIYPEEAKDKGIEGKVFVQFIIQKDGTLQSVQAVKGIGYGCDEEAVRVVKNGPIWIPGKEKGKAVDIRMILPISFRVSDSDIRNTESRTIKGVVVAENGEPIIGANVVIGGTHTGTISDGEGRFLIKIELGHTELVIAYVGMISQTVSITNEIDFRITMKTDDTYVSLSKSNNVGISIRASGKELMFEKDPPMFILNGEEISQEDFNQIQPDDIEGITVWKDQTAIEKYGEKGKNGVIIINTKNGFKLRTNKNLDIDKKNPPLIYKDGVEISLEESEKIDPNTIESINVIKGNSATEIYGKKGENGVILIKMKE